MTLAKMACELNITIPTVDLSPFFQEGKETGKNEAKEIIAHACRSHGFFQIVNHGLPVELMSRAIELSKAYFDRPDDEKFECKAVACPHFPLPAGYVRQPENSPNEYLMMFSPELGFNVYPDKPQEFKSTIDDCYTQLSKTSLLVEEILNDFMGLPPNFIKDYDEDRRSDVMFTIRYSPRTVADNICVAEHRDENCFSFVFQDDAGGLEVLKDGEWISADSGKGSIIVKIGDIVKVVTNNRFISTMHRVVSRERYRHSFVFSFNVDGEKWIEPLPQFTSEIGAPPEYKGFWYKDYLQLRMKNMTLPHEEFIDISRYAICPCK